MSGIVGLLYFDGRPVEREPVSRMAAAVAHRGSDRSGIWLGDGVGLGHLLRITTPESAGERGPFVNNRGDLAITADARIDNRDDLIQSLGLSHPAADITDPELILHAYDRWGEEAPAHLIGDFAFVISDAGRRRIFAARDHIGIRPFCYYHTAGMFAFASELKGLFALPEIPRRIDEVHVGDYLISLFDDTAITFYRDIRRLPPSHSLIATPEGIALRRYARLDSDREIRLGSNDEYAEAFREIFVEAVRCRTRSIHPVAAALSGGLDSSSVVCVARKILSDEGRGPLRTYSAVFDAMAGCDERRHISAVLEGGGIEPHYILADEVSPLVNLERLLHHLDEPFFAPNLFLHWELYRGARAAGAHLFLDGLDGDTTVSHGLAYLMELARKGRWIKMNRELTLLTKGYVRIGKSDLLRRAVLNPLLIRPLRKRWLAMRGKPAAPWGSDTAIDEGFARRIGLADRFEALGRGEQRAPRTLREEHRQRLEWGAHPFLLEVTDRSAWAFGVEPRYPFFDRRLIEFCLALPPDQKLSGGWTRMVLRRGMEGILPKQIQWRVDKSDLGPNFFRGLLLHEGDRLERLLAAEPNPLAEYADLPRLRDIMTRYRQHRAGDGEVLALWKAITLVLWLNRESGV